MRGNGQCSKILSGMLLVDVHSEDTVVSSSGRDRGLSDENYQVATRKINSPFILAGILLVVCHRTVNQPIRMPMNYMLRSLRGIFHLLKAVLTHKYLSRTSEQTSVIVPSESLVKCRNSLYPRMFAKARFLNIGGLAPWMRASMSPNGNAIRDRVKWRRLFATHLSPLLICRLSDDSFLNTASQHLVHCQRDLRVGAMEERQ